MEDNKNEIITEDGSRSPVLGEHYSVMKKEVVDILLKNRTSEGYYIDATFGRGGHTLALLEHGAKVIGLDRDAGATDAANFVKMLYPANFNFVHARFSDVDQVMLQALGCEGAGAVGAGASGAGSDAYVASGAGSDARADVGGASVASSATFTQESMRALGALWDFGLSTPQIKSNRGFSFQNADILDMRMGLSDKRACDILNSYSEQQLADMFFFNADERYSRKYARRIIELRKRQKILTCEQLLQVFDQRIGRIHPATKVFQALRMEVNQELQEIEQSLRKMFVYRSSGMVLVCISFHSGEDRIVKNLFKEWKNELVNYSKKPLVPSADEIRTNPASRSAKLRWCEFR